MHTADDVLAHLRVAIAAFVPAGGRAAGHAPAHLAVTLACVHSWRVVPGVRTLRLTVHTNDATAITQMLRAHDLVKPNAGWTVRVAPWAPSPARRGSKRPNNFLLAHAHLHEWRDIVRDRTSAATAFIHLEDDVRICGRLRCRPLMNRWSQHAQQHAAAQARTQHALRSPRPPPWLAPCAHHGPYSYPRVSYAFLIIAAYDSLMTRRPAIISGSATRGYRMFVECVLNVMCGHSMGMLVLTC